MSTYLRFDAVSFGKPVRTAEGYLRVPARVSQVGILEYPRKDGKGMFRELVTAEELHDPASMATLSLLPVTNLHPGEKVDSTNAKKTMRGITGETARKDGADGLGCDVVLMDEQLVEDAENGVKREVSAGYTCKLDKTPGTWNGQRYDAIQRERRYNHIAVVPEGRAGSKVRLRMDAAHKLTTEDGPMVVIKVDGKEFEVEQAVADHVRGLTQFKADATDKMATLKSEAQTREDALQGKLDAAEGEVKKFKTDSASAEQTAKFDAAVAQKVALNEAAKLHIKADALPTVLKLDALGIMKACIVAHEPELKLDGKSADYIQARFDALKPSEEVEKEDAEDSLGTKLAKTREDAAGKKSGDELRMDHNKKLSTAWQKPLGAAV